jgi:hypothetical protein
METLNFSFWQEIYSIAMGAISMFLVIVIHVYFRELKRLGLVPLWLWPSFIVGMPLVVSVLLIGSSVTGFSLDVLWSFVGSMPICWGINEKVLRQKMQPLVGPLRRKAYYSVLKDANLQRFFLQTENKDGFEIFLAYGLLVEPGEYLWKDREAFHADLQNFLDRNPGLALSDWKVDLLKAYNYQFQGTSVSVPAKGCPGSEGNICGSKQLANYNGRTDY